MIKYNEVIYRGVRVCVICDEVWYNNNEKVIPHRNCEWEEEVEEENDKKRPYFKKEDDEPKRYIKKSTPFSDTEPILPYLINRFGLENIYIKEDKIFKLILNPNLHKKLLREEKLNKLFN
jgi:hypothetical protein